jgi:DNA-binding GntR family transcriptional regulator
MPDNCKRFRDEVRKAAGVLEAAWHSDRAERRERPNPTALMTRHVEEARAAVFAPGASALDAAYEDAVREAAGNKELLFHVEKLKTAHREMWESALQGTDNERARENLAEAFEGLAELLDR